MSSEKHRVRLTIGGGRLGAQVELIHPETCPDLDDRGNCLLTDWVEEVGEELFADEISFEVPVFVAWPFEDEGPELYFETPPDIREERGVSNELLNDALALLDRIYGRKAPHALMDDGMVVEWIDEGIGAFIRKHGSFKEVARRIERGEA